MAEIVKARDTSDRDRIVAIKRILPHLCGDEHYRAMFLDESRVLTKLDHPSTVQALEVGEIDGTPYIALEFVDGQDAREVFLACERAGQPMPLGIACYVIARVCEGLQYVHDRTDEHGNSLGIVHRDVSLQNLLIGYDGEVKLTDFGIAVSAVNEVRTETGIVKGKFGYMSPEQVRGAKLDNRSDVFSTGICLYELLTGERLFSGENDYKAVERVRQADVPRPSSRNRQIPSTLENIVLKALAKHPRDRYASANDLRRALQTFLSDANLFIERADLGAYLRALFEKESQAVEHESSRRGPEVGPSQGQDTAIQPLPPTELFDGAEPTIVADGEVRADALAPGPAPEVELQAADLEVFGELASPSGHSVVSDASPVDTPVPATAGSDEPEAPLRPGSAAPLPEAPSQFDMDWDEQEPTTISRGFDRMVPTFAVPQRPSATAEPTQAPAAPKPSAASVPGPESEVPLSRQRSLPTLEIHPRRDTRRLTIALASAGAALAVFLVVYLLRGSGDAGIRIDTEPVDAIVRVDGHRLPGERSPFIATKLSPRERHTIVVEREGHASWSTTLKLPAGGIFPLPTVRLEAIAAEKPSPQAQPEPPDAAVPAEAEATVEEVEATVEPTPTAKPSRSSTQAKHDTVRASRASTRSAEGSDEGRASRTRDRPSERPAASTGTGTLRINTRPWSTVSVDGVEAGTTPLMNLKVSAGTHKLTLENPEFGIKQQLSVTVRAGQTVTRVLTLRP